MFSISLFQVVHFVAAVFFALAAYVQKNDPDSEIWMIIYFIPSFLSFATSLKPEFTEQPLIKRLNEMIIIGYGIYGGIIIDFSYDYNDNLFHWMLHNEAGREFSGLLIVTLWSAFMHGTVRKLSKRGILLSSLIVCVPALIWMYIYSNQSLRSLWPEHCQTALYPDFARAS